MFLGCWCFTVFLFMFIILYSLSLYIYIYMGMCNIHYFWVSLIDMMFQSLRLDDNSFMDTKTDEYLKHHYCTIQASQKTSNIFATFGSNFFSCSLPQKATQKSSSSIFIRQFFAVRGGGAIYLIGSFVLISFYLGLKNFLMF